VTPRRVTLQTIAEALGVSRTTVSNAYNRPDQLAPALREQVLETARRLGYAGPDPAARRLRSGRAEAVGLLFTEALSYAFTDPAALMMLQGIARATEAAHMPVLIVPSLQAATWGRARSPRRWCGRSASTRCTRSHPTCARRSRAGCRRRRGRAAARGPQLVGIVDRAGARAAAEHVVALGHRRIGAISERMAEDGYRGPLTPEREAGNR
jgi:DNA-binding LacI/PurR family transcriptional regulator